MTQLAEPISSYASTFRHLAVGDGAPWLEELRKAGIARFNLVGFPDSRRQEEWRFTNITPIVKTNFDLAPMPSEESFSEIVKQQTFGEDAVVELVFVDSHFVPSLSKLGKLPKGVVVRNLSDALTEHSALISKHLGKHADIEKNPFVALNTGFIQEGAFIYVPRSTTVEGAIHLLFISTAGPRPTVSHPRILVVAEDNSEVSFVSSFVAGEGANWCNAVTEVVAGADCRIDHNKLHHGGDAAYHVSTLQVSLGKNSDFVCHSATLGGLLTRNDLNVTLTGEYAHATLNGLVILEGNQHCDNHSLLDHAAANCPSHELFKHVLDGKSSGVFKGKILVRKDSQKTDSKQTSKSLLLSNDAVMNSQPALEIYADDVKCTHGSTTGPVDEEQIFYLRSRGVGHDAARHLMTYAFAADITRRIRVEPVRRRLENFMAAKHGLPLDLRIAELGSHDEAVVNI